MYILVKVYNREISVKEFADLIEATSEIKKEFYEYPNIKELTENNLAKIDEDECGAHIKPFGKEFCDWKIFSINNNMEKKSEDTGLYRNTQNLTEEYIAKDFCNKCRTKCENNCQCYDLREYINKINNMLSDFEEGKECYFHKFVIGSGFNNINCIIQDIKTESIIIREIDNDEIHDLNIIDIYNFRNLKMKKI